MITALTDYPFNELGDKPNAKAPVREVELLSYDSNKYVSIKFGGTCLTVKSGYLYTKGKHFCSFPQLSDKVLKNLPTT